MKFHYLVIVLVLFVANVVKAQEEDSTSSQKKDGLIFAIVEQPASPIGGMAEFYRYIGRTLQYPQEARNAKVQGRVFLSFIIGKDGNIEQESVKVIQGIHPLCDAEAIRVIKAAPKWEPATQRGKPVRQKITFPINFKL